MKRDSLKNRCRIIPRNLISDDRGWFLKVINGKEEYLPLRTGEIYLTSGIAGQQKGGHYHPKALEWFTLIQGEAILKLQDIDTLEYCEIELSFLRPVTVFIPNNVAHSIENRSNDNFVLLAYTDRLYDPADTIPFNIESHD